MIKVEDMMTRHAYTLQPMNTISDASALMRKHEIRHIPVVDVDDRLLGVVSQRDIYKAQRSCLEQDDCMDEMFFRPLKDIMQTDMMTVAPEASLKESAVFLQKHKIGCLPVVEQEHLVGIITDSDFVTIAINLLELQEEATELER